MLVAVEGLIPELVVQAAEVFMPFQEPQILAVVVGLQAPW